MSILENYQLQNISFGNGSDDYAESLYNQICDAETDETTPRLQVQVSLRLRNGKSVVEPISIQIVEEQFTNLRLLIDHYLIEYPVLHLLADQDRYLHACVVKTDEVTHADIMAQRIEINDEDIRRSKFTAGDVKNFEEGDAVPPLASA